MIEFEKWQAKRMVKTIGYLTNHAAYVAGEEAGWKAALKWVNSEMTNCFTFDDERDESLNELSNIVEKELGE